MGGAMIYLTKPLLVTMLLVSELRFAPVHGAPIPKTASKKSKGTHGSGVLKTAVKAVQQPRKAFVGELGNHFEGDILLPKDTPSYRGALRNESYRWPRATIYYMFADHITDIEKSSVEDAMRQISCPTCLRFVNDREPVKQDYLLITSDQVGCNSNVGRQIFPEKYQILNLQKGTDCWIHGTIVHELMHAIGFWHEHQRPDRDQYIRVLLYNVQDEDKDQFMIRPPDEVVNFGVPYDYGSIMHYPANAHAKDPTQPTIIPLIDLGGKVLGQREGMSPLDIRQINFMYNCYFP